jgi:hypothetical protein
MPQQKNQKPYEEMRESEVTSFVSGMKSNADAYLSEAKRFVDKQAMCDKIIAQQIIVLCKHIEYLTEDNRKARGAIGQIKAILLGS